MILKRILYFVLVFGGFFTLPSCEPFGCTDERAENYNSKAQEDDGSCNFSSRKIAFYTTSGIGGEIYIELSNTDVDYGGSYYGSTGIRSSSETFDFDPTDEYYPICGLSELAYFDRNTGESYYYDAHDKFGNVWSGTVSAEAGDCKLVELKRDSSLYGKLILYSSTQISSGANIKATPNPTGSTTIDNNKSATYIASRIHFATAPTCDIYTQPILNVNVGSAKIRLVVNGKVTDINTEIKSGGCTSVDISSYL